MARLLGHGDERYYRAIEAGWHLPRGENLFVLLLVLNLPLTELYPGLAQRARDRVAHQLDRFVKLRARRPILPPHLKAIASQSHRV